MGAVYSHIISVIETSDEDQAVRFWTAAGQILDLLCTFIPFDLERPNVIW